jgi:hypothetical protein
MATRQLSGVFLNHPDVEPIKFTRQNRGLARPKAIRDRKIEIGVDLGNGRA